MKKYFYLLIILVLFILGTFSLQYKLNGYFRRLQLLQQYYTGAFEYCSVQPIRGRGEFNGCVDEYIEKKSKESISLLNNIDFICDFFNNNLADKHICIEKILYKNNNQSKNEY